jgi:hypothetical protein
MSLFKQKGKSFVIPISKNPARVFYDFIPASLRVWWKLLIGGDHQTIIPVTSNHSAWILGVQPNEKALKKLLAEIKNQYGFMLPILVVNMLHDAERVIEEKDVTRLKKEGILSEMARLPWFDHSTLNVWTGKNQTTKEMQEFQGNLYKFFNNPSAQAVFYCHCMAGKSRSAVETLAFLYFYPSHELLFDFENWSKKLQDRVPYDLQNRLKNNPTFNDLARFIKIMRPDARSIDNLDGDQAGLLGLMALEKGANFNKSREATAVISEKSRFLEEAQDVGLLLNAPLGLANRDSDDVKRQLENLAIVYKTFQKHEINLLMAMIVPSKEKVNLVAHQNMEYFAHYFKKLDVRGQARFAILLKLLEENREGLNLGPLRGKSIMYAKIASSQSKKLTVGDYIELHKNFDLPFEPNHKGIVNRIFFGNAADKYNSEVNLAELATLSNKQNMS